MWRAGEAVGPGALVRALRTPRGADPGSQGSSGQAGPLVRARGAVAGHQAQHRLVPGVTR